METLTDFGCRNSLAMAPSDRAFLQAQKAMWPQPSGSRHYSPILGASGLQNFLAVVAAPWHWGAWRWPSPPQQRAGNKRE